MTEPTEGDVALAYVTTLLDALVGGGVTAYMHDAWFQIHTDRPCCRAASGNHAARSR